MFKLKDLQAICKTEQNNFANMNYCRFNLEFLIYVNDVNNMLEKYQFENSFSLQLDTYYRQLFSSLRKNPNGCPVSMSLYVQDQYTQYGLVSAFGIVFNAMKMVEK